MDAGRYKIALKKSLNTEYIEWFYNQYKNKGFALISNFSQLDEEDKEKTRKLRDFYESISKYAINNNIKPYQCKNDYDLNEKIYTIRLNDFICSIGIIYDKLEDSLDNKVFMSITRFGNKENLIDFNKTKTYIKPHKR